MKTITIEALNNSPLVITGRYPSKSFGQSLHGRIKHNGETFHFTYFQKLPEYADDELCRVTDNLQIDKWFRDGAKEVYAAIKPILAKLAA